MIKVITVEPGAKDIQVPAGKVPVKFGEIVIGYGSIERNAAGGWVAVVNISGWQDDGAATLTVAAQNEEKRTV